MTAPNLTAAHSAVFDMETPIRESQAIAEQLIMLGTARAVSEECRLVFDRLGGDLMDRVTELRRLFNAAHEAMKEGKP